MLPRVLCAVLLALPALSAPIRNFDFGSEAPRPGFTAVHPGDRFEREKGFGFDLNEAAEEGPGFVTGRGGFHFSVAVPPGNYRVRATFGGSGTASDNTVKAECRRLMLHAFRTEPGERREAVFTVNVRTPEIPGGGRVRLKEREKPYLHWDGQLTLEFNGARPAVDCLVIEPAPDATTVFLLGDSTVTDQPYEPWNSWGQMLPVFFDESVAVANHAESGESVRSSLGARRFEQVERTLKPGDFVLLQFGHNDMKDKAPDALETYRRNLVAAVERFRKLGGHPVLVTSMERKAGLRGRTLAGYPDAVRSVAKEQELPLIDLQVASEVLYRALGDRLDAAFQDGTHHNNFGSHLLARCVVEGIRREVPGLARHLRPGLPVFDPAAPEKPEDFTVPASPLRDPAKPDGD